VTRVAAAGLTTTFTVAAANPGELTVRLELPALVNTTWNVCEPKSAGVKT
jgi:hypothetical protein